MVESSSARTSASSGILLGPGYLFAAGKDDVEVQITFMGLKKRGLGYESRGVGKVVVVYVSARDLSPPHWQGGEVSGLKETDGRVQIWGQPEIPGRAQRVCHKSCEFSPYLVCSA